MTTRLAVASQMSLFVTATLCSVAWSARPSVYKQCAVCVCVHWRQPVLFCRKSGAHVLLKRLHFVNGSGDDGAHEELYMKESVECVCVSLCVACLYVASICSQRMKCDSRELHHWVTLFPCKAWRRILLALNQHFSQPFLLSSALLLVTHTHVHARMHTHAHTALLLAAAPHFQPSSESRSRQQRFPLTPVCGGCGIFGPLGQKS